MINLVESPTHSFQFSQNHFFIILHHRFKQSANSGDNFAAGVVSRGSKNPVTAGDDVRTPTRGATQCTGADVTSGGETTSMRHPTTLTLNFMIIFDFYSLYNKDVEYPLPQHSGSHRTH